MRVLSDIAALFWADSSCACCGGPRGEAALLCPDCERELAGYISCPACAAFVPRAEWPCHLCHNRTEFGVMLAAGPYAGALKERIRALKYHNRPQLAGPLGRMLAARWREYTAEADIIVPVPLHPSRWRQRGYNQSELLARVAARELKIPVTARALKRWRDTAVQHKLSLAEREANVAGAFAAGPGIGRVRGRRVILLDDIITSGATMRSCAAVLRGHGAAGIYALAVAAHREK